MHCKSKNSHKPIYNNIYCILLYILYHTLSYRTISYHNIKSSYYKLEMNQSCLCFYSLRLLSEQLRLLMLTFSFKGFQIQLSGCKFEKFLKIPSSLDRNRKTQHRSTQYNYVQLEFHEIQYSKEVEDSIPRENHPNPSWAQALKDAAPSGGWTPSGCCNPKGCGHPPAACQQRSGAADQVGSPPCLGSWP